MPREAHHSENTKTNSNSPWWTSAIALYIGVALLIIGVLLTIFLEGALRYIFGVPLALIGVLSPIAAHLLFGKNRD